MRVTVALPVPLRRFAQARHQVVVEAETVAEVLARLAEQYPGMAAFLLDGGGEVRPYLGVFLNRRDIRSLGGATTALADGDELTLALAMAGG